MAVFTLNSNITIGSSNSTVLNFKGVHEVRIKRSIHSYVDTATITLPSIAWVKYKTNATPQKVTTGNLWQDGDPVTINLGYNNVMQEEFRGFIKRRSLTLPLQIECEGYSWQLRRNKINGAWKSISVNDLLKLAITGTDIKSVICTVDTTLINMQAIDACGADIIDSIIKNTDGTLTIFFIQPDVLWCGLVYTPYTSGSDTFNLPQVSYRIGYNVVKDNALKERQPADVQIIRAYVKKTAKGQRLYGEYGVQGQIRKYKKFLNRIASQIELQDLAKEKNLSQSYTGYEGHISAFLQPFALPGYKAIIKDARYPALDATYVIESTEVTFGVRGARRIVEIGPKIGTA